MAKVTRILIADDHAVVRRGVQALLATCKDWEVCGEACTGSEAVEQAKQLKPDIVIMDISMPEMHGLEPVRQIHECDPHIGILMLTMHDSEAMVRAAIEAGAHAYVLKSDVDDRLIEAVEALCESRAFFSPGISNTILKRLVRGEAASNGPRNPDVLTPRQMEVVKLLAMGKSNKEVANALRISTRTAETHRYQIMNRLRVNNFSELVLYAVRNNIIDL